MNNKYIKKFEIPQSLSLLRNDDIQHAAKCAAAAQGQSKSTALTAAAYDLPKKRVIPSAARNLEQLRIKN